MRIKEFLKEHNISPVSDSDFAAILREARILEGRGLGARSPGEEFVAVNDPEQRIYFDSVQFYPEGGGQFESQEELQQKLKMVTAALKKAKSTVTQISAFKANNLGFGVATFKTPEGAKLSYIRPFQKIDPDPTANQWDNQKGIPGYKYNAKTAAKGQSGVSPQDVLTQTDNLTVEQVLDQISAHFGRNSPLTLLAANIAHGAKFPLEIPAVPGVTFEAFRDYFCEILHPLALQAGTVLGNAADAAKTFLPNGTFAGTKISFGSSKNEGLSDSVLTASDGAVIKLSSKGGAGAKASVTSLLKAAEEVKKHDPALYKTYRSTIQFIERIKEAGQYESPLMLAVEYGILNEKEAQSVRAMRGQALMPIQAIESMKITARLKKLMKSKLPRDTSKVNMYYHAMARVAHAVADHVNQHTDFGKKASAILNNGALVQIYTIATDKKGRWTIKEFNAEWPSKTTTGVLLSAEKPYFSTGMKGNFTFQVLRGGAKPPPEELEDTPPPVSAMRDRAPPKKKSPGAEPAPAKTPAKTPAKPRKTTR